MRNEEIRKDLRNTNLSMKLLAKKHGVSARTISNINSGSTNRIEGITYPIRLTSQDKANLKEKLMRPTIDAVPNPHVLSPQLLDYIGFLSLLEVGPECLIVFKKVYYKQLKKIFGRDLSDEEIASIIVLRPTRPRQLKQMLDAYENPKVKLINTEFWLKKGIISEAEVEVLTTILL